MSENPQTLTPMAIENPQPVAPVLTPQEREVLNGSVRQAMLNGSTMVGGTFGGIGGAIIGVIWGFASKTHKGFKTVGGLVAGAALGAIASRMTWGQEQAEKAVTGMNDQLAQMSPEEQRAAIISARSAVDGPRPNTQIQADSVQLQTAQGEALSTEPLDQAIGMISSGAHRNQLLSFQDRLDREKQFNEKMHEPPPL